MADELELLDSKNQKPEEINLDEIDDLDVLKEKYNSLDLKYKEVGDKNRQLFERTKKSEGELKELKIKIDENKPKEKPKKSDEFGLLEKAYLGSRGITDPEEIELFKKWHEDTGKQIDELINHPFVTAELEKTRTTKANQAATSNIKGESGISGAKNTPEYWIAKATANSEGKLAFPEDLPNDRKLRTAIAEKLMEQTKTGKMFYND